MRRCHFVLPSFDFGHGWTAARLLALGLGPACAVRRLAIRRNSACPPRLASLGQSFSSRCGSAATGWAGWSSAKLLYSSEYSNAALRDRTSPACGYRLTREESPLRYGWLPFAS